MTRRNRLSERSRELLADPPRFRDELERVMEEHPTLTRHGLGWMNPEERAAKYRHDLPGNSRERTAYRRQRAELAGCGNIIHALRYLALCRNSRVRQAHSQGMKHRAEGMAGPSHHVPNGAMIAATAMAGGRVVQQEGNGSPGVNADLYISEPRRCGEGGVRPDNGCRMNWIPAGSRFRLCEECRAAGKQNGRDERK